MGWDLNPRWACTHGGFQDRCLKPLGHPSFVQLRLLSRVGMGRARRAPNPAGLHKCFARSVGLWRECRIAVDWRLFDCVHGRRRVCPVRRRRPTACAVAAACGSAGGASADDPASADDLYSAGLGGADRLRSLQAVPRSASSPGKASANRPSSACSRPDLQPPRYRARPRPARRPPNSSHHSALRALSRAACHLGLIRRGRAAIRRIYGDLGPDRAPLRRRSRRC